MLITALGRGGAQIYLLSVYNLSGTAVIHGNNSVLIALY